MQRTVALIWCLLLVPLLAACVASEPYRTTLGPRPNVHGRLDQPPSPPNYSKCKLGEREVAVVEFDDYGNLMNRFQLECALRAVDAAANDGAVVLVFVHGWHNSAKPSNTGKDIGNLASFKSYVESFSSSQKELARIGVNASANVVGLFVAWRGDSIAASGLTLPLSYALTFWDRKAAAQAIGHGGGVTELMLRLERIRQTHESSRLVAIGHSFGDALLHASLNSKLIDQALSDLERSKDRALTQVKPTCGPKEGCRLVAPDLLVLINPAIEAIRLRPYMDLVRNWTHSSSAAPRLIVATSETDFPVRRLFPVGRAVSTIFDGYADDSSSEQNRTAIGRYGPFVTHELRMTDLASCSSKAILSLDKLAKRAQAVEPPAESLDYVCMKLLQDRESPRALWLQRCDEAGKCKHISASHFLKRGDIDKGDLPMRLPYLNIRVSSDVADGHNDIWNKEFEAFLTNMLTAAVNDPGSLPTVKPPAGAQQ